MLLSPPGAPAQPWHLDYAREFSTVDTIFVAATAATADNATEVPRSQGREGWRGPSLWDRAREPGESSILSCEGSQQSKRSDTL